MDDVQDRVFDIIAKETSVPRDKLQPEAKLSDVDISSLDMVETIFAIEEAFDIEIPFNANASSGVEFETLGQMVALVQQKIDAKGGSAAAAV